MRQNLADEWKIDKSIFMYGDFWIKHDMPLTRTDILNIYKFTLSSFHIGGDSRSKKIRGDMSTLQI